MSHAEAHRLLTAWASVELAEIRKQWYPYTSSGYRDYEPPRDPEARQEREIRRVERDWTEIDRTGWCLMAIRQVHRETLRRHYRDGGHVGNGARRAALDTFARTWAIWSDSVDGPINSL